MLLPAPEHTEADAAFERLRQSSAYVSVNENIKQKILRAVWPQCITTLRKQLAEEAHGFGFFVEVFAKESGFLKARQNTKKAAEIELFLLDCLQRDLHCIFGDGNARCNPDHIWIRLKGRQVICTGIGEIKASVQAITKKPDQLYLQEKNIRHLIEYIEKHKQSLNIPFLRKRCFGLADKFERAVIVPKAGASTPPIEYIPSGWTITEFEWTYDELVFLAQHLCAKFRKKIFTENEYADYTRSIQKIFSRAKEIITVFFQDIPLSPDSLDIITFTATIFGICPNNETDLAFLQEIFPSKTRESLFRNLDAPGIRSYSKEEQTVCEKLQSLGLPRDHRERFLATRRLLCSTYRKKTDAHIQRLPAFNPFEHF